MLAYIFRTEIAKMEGTMEQLTPYIMVGCVAALAISQKCYFRRYICRIQTNVLAALGVSVATYALAIVAQGKYSQWPLICLSFVSHQFLILLALRQRNEINTLHLIQDTLVCIALSGLMASREIYPASLFLKHAAIASTVLVMWARSNAHGRVKILDFVWSAIILNSSTLELVPTTPMLFILAELISIWVVVLRFSTPKNLMPTHPKRKCIMMCLDGFIGPEAVVCGIKRTYETWVTSMLKDDPELIIVLVTAFDAQELKAHFNKHMRLVCYQLESHTATYVQQNYSVTIPSFSNFRRMVRILQTHKPSVVHTIFDGLSTPIVSAACSWVTVTSYNYAPTVVGVVHTDAGIIFERNGFGPVYSKLLMFSQRVLLGSVVHSLSTRSKSFAAVAKKKYGFNFDYVIKPHVNTDIFKIADAKQAEKVLAIRKQLTYGHPEAMLIVYAGRFDLDKNIHELLKMVEAVPQGVYLALIGNGMMRDDLMKLSCEKNHIYVSAGFVSHEQLAEFYQAADLHVSASQMETLGNTVLESVACGTPVLVPGAQGFKDTVIHGETGELWNPESLDDGIERLKQLRNDKKRLSALKDGAKAYALRKENAIETTVAGIRQWYASTSGILESRNNAVTQVGRFFCCSAVFAVHMIFDKLFMKMWIGIIEKYSNDCEREKQLRKLSSSTSL